MAINNSDYLGFGEFVKRMGEGPAREILEVARDRNAMLSTAMVTQGNEVDGNVTVARTEYIDGQFVPMYGGVSDESSKTEELRDSSGTLETFSAIATRLIDRSADGPRTRFEEDKSAMIGFSQTMENEVFNGDQRVNTDGFTGFYARYPDLETVGNRASEQVVDAAGTGNGIQTSMWLVTWDQMATYLFFGKNVEGGLQITDLGKQEWTNPAGGRFMAWVNHFEWNLGLTVRDFRSNSRIANINTTDLLAGNVTLVPLMTEAFYKIPAEMQSMRKAWYCSTEVLVALTKEAQQQANTYLTIENFEGKPIVSFYGIPIYRSDKIGVTDDPITTA